MSVVATTALGAQVSGTPPVATPTSAQVGAAALPWRWQLTGSLRSRVEDWRWFDTTAAGDYRFSALLGRVGLHASRERWTMKADVAVPLLLGLPRDASAPVPLGQYGLGASYAAASTASGPVRSNVAGVFVRQLHAEWKSATTVVRVGRMDVTDGTERPASTPTGTALKQQRVAQRLIGPFGFTHGQRAMDGAYVQTRHGSHVFSATAFRPTSGVFTVTRAGQSLPVNIAYGAWSTGGARRGNEWDARLFGMWYEDDRDLVPTDNRPATIRTTASRTIRMMTGGGHALLVRQAGRWQWDALAWGAYQRGTWSDQAHRAYAAAAEIGIQRPTTPWSPWLRLGHYRSSGDRNATDRRHETFFQILPTPRIYARMPFYNGMNSEESFVYLVARPQRTVSIRSGLHDVRVASLADQWLLGGGAFDDRSFGYVGRPANSALGSRIGLVHESSIEWRPTTRLSLEGFLARVYDAQIPAGIYGRGSATAFSYLEVTINR